jgi:hypothetical protein
VRAAPSRPTFSPPSVPVPSSSHSRCRMGPRTLRTRRGERPSDRAVTCGTGPRGGGNDCKFRWQRFPLRGTAKPATGTASQSAVALTRRGGLDTGPGLWRMSLPSWQWHACRTRSFRQAVMALVRAVRARPVFRLSDVDIIRRNSGSRAVCATHFTHSRGKSRVRPSGLETHLIPRLEPIHAGPSAFPDAPSGRAVDIL